MCVTGHTFFVTQFVSFKDANTFEVFYSKDLAAEQVPLACKKKKACHIAHGCLVQSKEGGGGVLTF